MAYSAPTTRATGFLVTAAVWNQDIVDNQNAAFPLGIDAWTTWATTVTQSGSVTHTVNYAKYQRIGRTIHYAFRLTMTGAGTAANRVSVSLPVSSGAGNSIGMGNAVIFDASATTKYHCLSVWLTATTICFEHDTSTSDAWGATPNVALASGDVIFGSGTYEAAS